LGVGRKTDDLALQKNLMLRNPKKSKPGGLIHDGMGRPGRIFYRRLWLKKCCFVNDDDDDDDDDDDFMC
jgi:hypothetical protein